MDCKEQKVLIVNDEENLSGLFKEFLKIYGFNEENIRTAKNTESALRMINEDKYDVLFTVPLRALVVGREIIDAAIEKNPNCKIFVNTGGSTERAIKKLAGFKPDETLNLPLDGSMKSFFSILKKHSL